MIAYASIMPPSITLVPIAARPSADPEISTLPAAKLLSGNPVQRVWNAYADPDGRFFAGHWESEPGKWSIRYTEQEYCEILAGRSVITDAAGAATEVGPGDRFVIPAGFEGTWEVLETTRKIYVIHEPAS